MLKDKIQKMYVVISYDINDDTKRQRVAKVLESIIKRVQYSVFEGEVPAQILNEKVREALRYIDKESDSLRVYRLCASCVHKADVYGRIVPTRLLGAQIY
jgi:CRISPR-associated protein Cas2